MDDAYRRMMRLCRLVEELFEFRDGLLGPQPQQRDLLRRVFPRRRQDVTIDGVSLYIEKATPEDLTLRVAL